MEAILQVIEEALEASGYQVTALDARELGVTTGEGTEFTVLVDFA